MHFYQRLRDLREDHDKSQAEVAQILGTAREQYHKYESGKQELPMHHFITLARYYNVSLDYIAGLTDTPKAIGGKPYKMTSKNITINNQGGNNNINIKN